MAFTGDVVVRQLDARTWALVEPLTYRGNRDTFTVPEGFVTDFASVPRVFVWLLPTYGVYTKAAILHDHLWGRDDVTKADADGLFRRSMRELGVSVPRRWMMWAAVRLASRMQGATAADWLRFVPVALLSAAFVVVPALVVQLFLLLYWLVELLFWLVQRSRSATAPRPAGPVRTT